MQGPHTWLPQLKNEKHTLLKVSLAVSVGQDIDPASLLLLCECLLLAELPGILLAGVLVHAASRILAPGIQERMWKERLVPEDKLAYLVTTIPVTSRME